MADENNTNPPPENKIEVSVETAEVVEESTEVKEDEKRKFDTSTIIAIGALLILIAAIVLMSIYFFKYRNTRDDYSQMKESTKLLEVENQNLQHEIQVLNGENKELDNSLGKAFQGISARDIVIRRLNEENETLKLIRVQVGELQNVMEGLATSNTQLKEVHERLNKITSNKLLANEKWRAKIKK